MLHFKLVMQSFYIRDEWKSQSQPKPTTWNEIYQKILKHPHRSDGAAVVFDLDSTLYNVQPRTFEIIREWRESSHSKSYGMLREIAHALTMDDIHYSLKDTFENKARKMNYEIHPSEARGLRSFWTDRFFTSEYLKHDHLYPGALDAVKNVHSEGFHVIYLTGREEATMLHGTRSRLEEDGFPMHGNTTRTILRTDENGNDLDHKVNALESLKVPVICSIENEPANLVAMKRTKPDAIHVLKDTVCSDKPAPVENGVYLLKSFK